MPYAEHTQVQSIKSEMEIKALLQKHGAISIFTGYEGGIASVLFRMRERQVRFSVRLPTLDDARWKYARAPSTKRDEEVRRLWRCLLLSIKSKLEVTASGIESFESSFLAQIVIAPGRTVADHVLPQLAAHYAGGDPSTKTFLGLPAGSR